jgi:RNA polymerase subunit RPABC4/transcription elongation factor Spt4
MAEFIPLFIKRIEKGMVMENFIGKICPFCKTQIEEGDALKVCPACGIPHHEGCWEENKGCTTFGCSEQHYEIQGTNPTDVCKNCGATLGDGQAFCPKCGTPKQAVQAKICKRCQAELTDEQEFCPKCGQKYDGFDSTINPAIQQFNDTVGKKKKKSKVLPIVLAIVIAVAGIGGYFTYSTIQKNKEQEAIAKKQEAIADYKDDAQEFLSAVITSGTNMENIGNAIQSAWGKYVNNSSYGTYYNGTYIYSVDSAVKAAQDEQSSKISAVKSNDSKIQSLYKSLLVVPDPEDQELQEIKEAVKELYDAYEDMYDVVIDVSGNYTSFKSDFGDVDSEIADTVKKLNNLLN